MTVEKVDGDEYHEHLEETATVVTEEMTHFSTTQPTPQQHDEEEETVEEEASQTPQRTLVAPNPPCTNERPKRTKPRSPEEWERLVATWQKMDRQNQSKQPQTTSHEHQQQQEQSPAANSSNNKPTEPTHEDENSLHSFYPEAEKESQTAPLESSEESCAPGPPPKPKNAMGCVGKGVFPFCFLSKKKTGEAS